MFDMEYQLKRLREKKSALQNEKLAKGLQGKTFAMLLLEMRSAEGLYPVRQEKFSEKVLLIG